MDGAFALNKRADCDNLLANPHTDLLDRDYVHTSNASSVSTFTVKC